MTTALLELERPVQAEPIVARCYDFLDALFSLGGIEDYTEGIYRDQSTTYERAQKISVTFSLTKSSVKRDLGFSILVVGLVLF